MNAAPATVAPARGRLITAALLVAGGVLTAAGGQLHPTGSGATVEAHLLSMFEAPGWTSAHTLLLVGAFLNVLAAVAAWRAQAFGPRVQRLLPVVGVAWGFGALELVPHLLAAGEAADLAHHHPRPVLDLHLVLQLVAAPVVGTAAALLAFAVARAARTWPARVLGVIGVVGGLFSAPAAPLVVLTGDPRFAVLFAFQAGTAVWLVGTGVRLLRR